MTAQIYIIIFLVFMVAILIAVVINQETKIRSLQKECAVLKNDCMLSYGDFKFQLERRNLAESKFLSQYQAIDQLVIDIKYAINKFERFIETKSS